MICSLYGTLTETAKREALVCRRRLIPAAAPAAAVRDGAVLRKHEHLALVQVG